MSKDEGDNSSLNSLSSLTRNEDESATTTSTESDSIESWTLITEKQRPPKKTTELKPTEQQKEDTLLITEVYMKNNPINTTAEHDKEVEEFSDGISIISESSESVERFSPHPLLREQLHNMLPEDPLPTLFTQEPLEELDTDEDQHSFEKEEEDTALQQTQLNSLLEQNKHETRISTILTHDVIKSGISALFYVGVTLALLSFVGRLRNPEWDISSGKSLEEFEQKINNLEMQHNLMIAEIDLLSKQVKYLTDLNAGQAAAGPEQKTTKKFKAWSGNGKNLYPVEINKEDLKKAYKCGEDGRFVEIGGVCVDRDTVSPEILMDQAGNVVNDMLQDSETYKSFEKVAEAFLSKGSEAEPLNDKNNNNNNAPPIETNYKDYVAPNKKSNEEYKNKFSGQPKKAYFKKQSNERNDSNEDDDEDDSKEHKHEIYNDNSKERYNKMKKSKEYRNNSKERYDKKQRKQSSSEERVDKSKDPYWHEKLMQQREELRRQRQHNNANNWYIERGDSREQARRS